MAKIEQVPGGGLISVKLEQEDFRVGAWREFLDRVKTLPGREYDGDLETWFVPEEHFVTVVQWKKELLLREDPRQDSFF